MKNCKLLFVLWVDGIGLDWTSTNRPHAILVNIRFRCNVQLQHSPGIDVFFFPEIVIYERFRMIVCVCWCVGDWLVRYMWDMDVELHEMHFLCCRSMRQTTIYNMKQIDLLLDNCFPLPSTSNNGGNNSTSSSSNNSIKIQQKLWQYQ